MNTGIMRLWACRVLLWVVALIRGTHAGIGFCIESTQPPALQGTGYATISSITTQAACTLGGHNWCPLDDETGSFDWEDPVTGAVSKQPVLLLH